MAHDGFKESDFQNGLFIPYLSAPPPGRPQLMMADYEGRIVSGGKSIAPNPVEKDAGAEAKP
jgi:hypothetical protein